MKKIFTLIAMLVCSAAMFAADYTDTLKVSVNGQATQPNMATLSITQQENGKYTVALKNFMFSAGPQTMPIGTVTLTECTNTSTDASQLSFNETNVVASVTNGDIPGVTWIGPTMLQGQVSITSAVINAANGKIHAVMSMSIPGVGVVDVELGRALSSGKTWDFTKVQVLSADGTGNLTGAIVDDGGTSFSAIYNQGVTNEGEKLMLTSTTEFPYTEGITFSAFGDAKYVLLRNYPENYGGCHFYANKEITMTLPVKAGQHVVIYAASNKDNKTIKCGETSASVNKVASGSMTAADYNACEFDVTADNPAFVVNSAIYMSKIVVSDASGINDVKVVSASKSGKYIENGKIVILNNGQKFNVSGARVK